MPCLRTHQLSEAGPTASLAPSTPTALAERRQLTIMFCDMVGEEQGDVIAAFHTCCANEITVERALNAARSRRLAAWRSRYSKSAPTRRWVTGEITTNLVARLQALALSPIAAFSCVMIPNDDHTRTNGDTGLHNHISGGFEGWDDLENRKT